MTSPTPEEALASVIRDAMKEAMNPTAQTFRLPAPSDSRSWETPMKAIGVTMEDVSAHIARAILASGYALPAESGEYGHLVANALARMRHQITRWASGAMSNAALVFSLARHSASMQPQGARRQL